MSDAEHPAGDAASGMDPFEGPEIHTEADAARVAAWVRYSADRLGLRDWRFSISRRRALEASNASSFIRDHGDESWIALAPEFFEMPERYQRASLTHEILHPHFQRFTRLFEKLVERELGNRTEAVMFAAVSEMEEQAIDRLAWAISALLPPVAR